MRPRTRHIIAAIFFAQFITAPGVIAQSTEDELMQQWFFYDKHRVDKENLIRSWREIAVAKAIYADRQDAYLRGERLVSQQAISEDKFKRLLRDRDVAGLEIALAEKKHEIMTLKTKISDLRWRWHRGEERNIQQLEKLQFDLWHRQCACAELRARRLTSQISYAAFREGMIKRLAARNAATIDELHDAQTERAVLHNQHEAEVEIHEECKNGPPFKRIFPASETAT